MKFLLYLGFFIFFITTKCFSQDNEIKILGCWKLIKTEYLDPEDNVPEIINEAKSFKVCFTPNGKFSTEFPNNEVKLGSYSFSADRKTIFQKRDAAEDGTDDDLEIIMLTEKRLVIESQFSKLSFEKVVQN